MGVDTGARSLLVDGSVVAIRRIEPADHDAVDGLHRQLPPLDRYRRFFTLSDVNADMYTASITGSDDSRPAVGAFADGRLIGVASYVAEPGDDVAEFAMSVVHEQNLQGVGTLLLEELVSIGRLAGLRALSADVLVENTPMLRLIDQLGLAVGRRRVGEVVEVEIQLDDVAAYRRAVLGREHVADVASLRAVLRPTSVAVVGAGRRPESIGHALLSNIVKGGFEGALHAVNPHARTVAGVPCVPAVADLPDAPDLAVLCVPARAVAAVARECGERGAKALLVVTAGLSAEDAATLREVVREFGMRMVGPNCLGVYASEPGVRLNATFARNRSRPGSVGVVTQSGGVAIALFDTLDRLGLGVSTLVSTGDKYDVSGNDLLQWWSADDRTKAAVLYLESFGNPRKFSALCREVARTKPVLAVRPPGSAAAQRAASSHTAALATPSVTADALFRQAGVTVVDRLAELPETLAALVDQPVPAGGRVAVISNAGGAGVLAADAVSRAGLTLPALSADTDRALRACLSAQSTVANPVDTGAVVTDAVFAECVAALLADPAIDAVVAIAAPTALSDPIAVIADSGHLAHRHGTPLLAVHLGQTEGVVRLNGDTAHPVACYADPAAAAAALGRAVQRARWLNRPGERAEVPGFDAAEAARLIRADLARRPGGGWLDPEAVVRVLGSVGVPIVPGVVVTSADDAVAEAVRIGGPVALKAVATGLLHKNSGGGVLLGRYGEPEVRAGYTELADRFGDRLTGVFVQAMADTAGVELLVGVKGDPMFGPLVVFGLGGVDTDLIADRAARLAPVTAGDLDELVHGLRGSAAIAARIDQTAVRDVVARIGLLAEAVPEIAELDVNPLIATPHGCLAVDARVRVAPARRFDPLLRHLRL
ncbi:bifunctional acetate--CoA ligase family protein/GNAT family N-acetyltransferase [Actinokineospora sp. HUAS TT18]|uniref:bifunctional acetate--CoA ligase family protein/GNAT family N-acetyltransferase n=1 Tax=Actinokineospora sp. HUAS TT18 TaxID=3447451 RepID=UPI003F51ACD9